MGDAKFSFPKLNGTNWATWKIRIENVLCREDLWVVVVNELPEEKDQDDEWKCSDRKAKSTIVLLIEDSQLPLIKNCVHAKDVFGALRAFHQKTSRSVRVSVLKRLCSLNLAEHEDVEKHLTEIDELFDRLDAAGTVLDADTKVCMLLRNLPPSFDGLVTALDSRSEDDISLDVVKAKITDEYQRRVERECSATSSEKALRSAEAKHGKESRVCHFCKKVGHLKRNCRKYAALNKEGNSVSVSKMSKNYSAKAKAVDSDSKGVAFIVSKNKSAWIIDSGASAHMTNERSFFTTLKEFSGGFITLADGNKKQILGEGHGTLRGVDGNGEEIKIDVYDVKYVPDLSVSLISVERLAQKNLKVCFDKEGCQIKKANGVVAVTGFRYGGLYYLRLAECSMQAAVWPHTEGCKHQWHRRLGHRDWAAAERINKESLATGMKVSDCGIKLSCECCMEGKAARIPFPSGA